MPVIVVDVAPSESFYVSQDLCITGLSLRVPPGRDSSERAVTVWADDSHHTYAILGTLSSEAPIVAVLPRLVVGDGFLLRHDAVSATVRFYARALDPPPSIARAEQIREAAIVDDAEVLEEDGGGEDEVADEASWVEFAPLSEEEEAERYDSDNSEDDNEDGHVGEGELSKSGGGESSKKNILPPLVVATPQGTVMSAGKFIGPARFAAVENTAGFMRLAASEPATNEEHNKILVLYRYTRFSRTWSGRRGVEVCRRTKLHFLRFAVPPAGDMSSSLAWAGASLGPLLYPALFSGQLHELWTMLAAAPPLISSIPSRATRIQVIVDAGILRREDYSSERMYHMRGELEAQMQQAWPERYHVAMELDLPELVRREEEQECGGDARPAKRRRIVDDEEDCSVCLDPLELGLAAWPGCRHVYHAACVEKMLARSDMCPLCRNKLCRHVVAQ